MSNLEELIKAAKNKHAAALKALRKQAAREEQQLLVHVARLLEQHDPERFAHCRDQAALLIEQERTARAARAKAARARRKEQSEAVYDGGGEAQ